MTKERRVCIIGAGPSGLSTLCWFSKLGRAGRKIPEVVCYEKQADWGGLWNGCFDTGMDRFGEPVHSSMYKHLWVNAAKEVWEIPHYTYYEHFKKAIPSCPPRGVMFDYLTGRWKKEGVKEMIQFNTSVREVIYNEITDDFTVSVDHAGVMKEETFDYVIVASGHFSTPNFPTFPGLENFTGRVLHSHDYRDPSEFAGLDVLVIGSSFSAQDIALQSVKYGANSVTLSYRTKPIGLVWPESVEEKSLVSCFDGKIATFQDGSKKKVDALIMCTGYLHSYPFLREDLRLKCENSFYPPNLYKGMLWTKSGNYRLFYIGTQNQLYSFNMFDVCGLWITKQILGEISLPSKENMEKSCKQWIAKLPSAKDLMGNIDFQTDYIQDLAEDCGADFPYDLDMSDLMRSWVNCILENVATFRDHIFISKYTGTESIEHKEPFMLAMDDSFDNFVNQSG